MKNSLMKKNEILKQLDILLTTTSKIDKHLQQTVNMELVNKCEEELRDLREISNDLIKISDTIEQPLGVSEKIRSSNKSLQVTFSY